MSGAMLALAWPTSAKHAWIKSFVLNCLVGKLLLCIVLAWLLPHVMLDLGMCATLHAEFRSTKTSSVSAGR